MNLLNINRHELKEGLNYIYEWDCWIFKEFDNFSMVENRCRHEGARFIKDKSCSENLFCPKHGWTLNVKSGSYINPLGLVHINKRTTIHSISSDSIILCRKDGDSEVKKVNLHIKALLSESELTLKFINHACCVVNASGTSLTTDPWILGPSFCTGWFLQKPTYKLAVKSILESNFLYISHSHPDHLNLYSLVYLKKMGWDPIVILPKFQRKDVSRFVLETLGFKYFQEVSNSDKLQIGQNLQVRVFTDASGRNDSSLEIDYKGFKILNLVDTPNPDLPENYIADVVLAPFAGGASGFPVCWGDMYSHEKIHDIVKKNQYQSLAGFVNRSVEFNPRLVIPFAGYFKTPLDCDKAIDLMNKKNSPEDVCRIARTKLPNCLFIVPREGEVFDLSKIDTDNLRTDHWNIGQGDDLVVSLSPMLRTPEDYLNFLYENYNNFTKDEVVEFLKKQSYFSDLTILISSYDINYVVCYWDLIWDFRHNQELNTLDESVSLSGKTRLLKIRVRNFAIGMTIRNSLPWEEFTIGFQSRFSRNPDTYNFDFWDYFQNQFVPHATPCLDLYVKLLNAIETTENR